MPDTFDPYVQWLSINDPQRPPHHYALLGLPLYDTDQERIANSAMQRMALVLEHDPGPYSQVARRIFDELETARACLGDPQRKQAYDTKLRLRHAGAKTKKAETVGVATQSSYVLQDDDSGSSASFRVSTSLSDSSISRRTRDSSPKPPAQPSARGQPIDARQMRLLAAAAGGVLLIAVACYYLLREPPELDPTPALMVQLRHSEPQQRLAAARELRKLGTQASNAVPLLVERLGEEPNDNVRIAVAEALVNTGPAALSYGPQLQQLKERETQPAILQIIGELSGR